MIHSLEVRGISEPTVTALNSFVHSIQRLNRSLPVAAQLLDSVLSEKVANAVRRLSDNLSTLLDVKLPLNSGVGDLALTIGAARSVLSDAEARNVRRELELNPNTAHAFAVRSKEARSKTADPKRPRPEPNEKWSNKWAPCRWCKGAHWHKDCPKRRSKGDKTSAKQDRRGSDSRAALAAAEADVDQKDVPDSALGALFARDGGDVAFTLDASGRALCLRSADAEASLEPVAPADDHPEVARACRASDVSAAPPPTGVMNRTGHCNEATGVRRIGKSSDPDHPFHPCDDIDSDDPIIEAMLDSSPSSKHSSDRSS
eukprot:3338860-Pleurochrysis_carterae.AAC.1